MTVPTLVVKVALDKGPNDDLTGATWTDLSSRVRGTSRGRRGRTDVMGQFPPGTCTITLDNSDRMLDPLNPDGIVYLGDGLGLPLCPVTVDWRIGSTDYRKFTGYVGPDGFSGSVGVRAPVGEVELTVVDMAAYSPDLPMDAWGAFTQATAPDFWLRMDGGFPVLADGSLIPNRSGTGGSGVVASPSGISRYSSAGGLGGSLPTLILAVDNTLTIDAADAFPDGDELNWSIWFIWTGVTAIGTGDSATVLRLVSPGGSTKRLEIVVDDNGEAQVETFDAAGSSIDTATITPSLIARWDNSNPHLVQVRYESGNNCEVRFGGDVATLTATAAVYESDVILGPADVDTQLDEVTIWRRLISDGLMDGAVLATGGLAGPWHGDDWLDRLGHWYDCAGKTVDVDVTDEWHMPSPDPDDGLFGLGKVSNIPANLTQAVQTVADWAGGAAWVTKEGYWRVRSLPALTDAFYAAFYQTVAATFTDDPGTLGTDEYRHAGVTPTGISLDRIINRAETSFYVRADPPSNISPTPFTITPTDGASIARYGQRSDQHTSEWWGWEANASIADDRITRFAEPSAGPMTVRLHITGDGTEASALTLWLADVCELELAVEVTYTPWGDDPVTTTLNIQAEDWSLSPETLVVDLTVAKS